MQCSNSVDLCFLIFASRSIFPFFFPLWIFFLLVLCFFSLILSESPQSIAKFGYGIRSKE